MQATQAQTGVPLSDDLKAWKSLEPGANVGCFHLLESNLLPSPWGTVPPSLCEVLVRRPINA